MQHATRPSLSFISLKFHLAQHWFRYFEMEIKINDCLLIVHNKFKGTRLVCDPADIVYFGSHKTPVRLGI